MGLMPRIQDYVKVALLTSFIGGAMALGAGAQEIKEDKVIAIVNGHEIKISEVQMATDDIIGQLPDLPPKLRYPFVVEFLEIGRAHV